MQDHNTPYTFPAFFYTKRKAAKIGIAAVLGAAIVLAALSGCQGSDPKTSPPENAETESTIDGANANPGTATESDVKVGTPETTAAPETQPPEEIDYEVFPENVAEGYSFERALNEEQQALISQYNELSLEEFRALPESEQLTFAYWVFENYQPRFEKSNAQYVEILKEYGKEYKVEYTIDPQTAEEYADNYFYTLGFVNNIFIRDESVQDIVRDVNTGKKCMVMFSSYGADLFNRGDPSLDNLNEIYDNFSMSGPDYTESAMTEEDGKIIVTTRRPLISADGGEPEYDTQVYTYVVTEFQDIYGNPVSFRQCVSVDYPT
jgi:hypothetical protein